jgi:rod shape determining protein RodA
VDGCEPTLGAGILLIRGELFREMAFGIYGFVILLLVAVLLFGKEVNGAKAWFAIGGFGIQPAEFAKFATALALSRYLSGLKALVDTRSRVISTAIILFPVTLIMLQPDTGTALVSGAFILVLYREGLSGNVLLLGILAAVLSILSLILKESSFDLPFTDKVLTGQYFLFALITVFTVLAWWLVRNLVVKRMRKRLYGLIVVGFISSAAFIGSVDYAFEKVLATHQRDRILVMLGQKEDPQGLGYNVKQSQTAIGSGGFAGKGYLDGTLTKFKYVPMQSTDFIFCTVGEEWGFIGHRVRGDPAYCVDPAHHPDQRPTAITVHADLCILRGQHLLPAPDDQRGHDHRPRPRDRHSSALLQLRRQQHDLLYHPARHIAEVGCGAIEPVEVKH